MRPTQILRQKINNKEMIIAPGIFDSLSALLAKQAGFSVLYASGGAIARSMGYPDIGLITMTEVCAVLSHIVSVTKLPVIADADTGYGNAINVARTIEEYERLGVAGLHLEDQTFPKRCGHLNDKSLIPMNDMCQKIKVAKASASDPDFVIIARTDAIANEGFEQAIERARAYIEAGADVIFIEAPETMQQIEDIAKLITHPKLINMFHGGKTPMVNSMRLQELGYNIVIIPSDLQRASIKAMQNVLSTIKQEGNSMSMADQLVTFKEREAIIETEKYLKKGGPV